MSYLLLGSKSLNKHRVDEVIKFQMKFIFSVDLLTLLDVYALNKVHCFLFRHWLIVVDIGLSFMHEFGNLLKLIV